ncbi:MAG: ATP-binding protein, partial [archaeon]|nr:ATP-binding protein [archaeon]
AAGLTAAAVQDANADGRWTLEAGALVLADLGLAAIDEFDKMNDGDRSSMHEAMEQQRISIAKAGITASLRTRCAVLAAANPKQGRFQPISDVPFTAQINLAPPLVSRFDVIWVLTDTPKSDLDESIARHILNTRAAGTSETLIAEGSALDPSRGVAARTPSEAVNGEALSRSMIQKYVAYAKRNIQPEPTEEASKKLVDYYVETRRQGGEASDSIAITARAIEGISRLAEASARIRLSERVEVQDAERALRITRLWRMELMGDNYDETTLVTGKKTTARTKEKIIRDAIESCADANGVADRNDVLTEIVRNGMQSSEAEDLIDKMVQQGGLLRPRGYDTLMVA